jgi:hypothetical protein
MKNKIYKGPGTGAKLKSTLGITVVTNRGERFIVVNINATKEYR